MEAEQEQVPHIDQVQGVIVGDYGQQVNNLIIQSPRKDAPLGKRQRQIFLKRIKAHVEEGIKFSLYSEVLRELKLSTRSQEVTHPWQFTFHPSLHDEYELPFGTSIKDVYDQTQGSLLILGEGGGGKTTLLFQLALHLLQQTEQDENEPIPIIVNLSSWAEKKPFDQWLIEVLARRPYEIPHKTTQKLIEQDLLIPLLDGFNQVAETERLACARAIRDYWKEHSLIPLVICSRDDKDLKQEKYDFIDATVSVHPLTPQQVDVYISSIDNEKIGLKKVFSKDRSLYELATTPLMLCMITLACYHGSIIPWTRGTLDSRRKQLFALYVVRMLERKDIPHAYSPQDMGRWLIRLAQQMGKNHETTFYIEYMQPRDLFDLFSEGLFHTIESLLTTMIWVGGFTSIVDRISKACHLNVPLLLGYYPNLLEIFSRAPSFVRFLLLTLFLLCIREVVQSRAIHIIPSKTIWLWQIGQHKKLKQITQNYWKYSLFSMMIVGSMFRYTGLPSTIPELATALLFIILLLDKIRVPVPLLLLENNVLLRANQGIWENTRQGLYYGLGSGIFAGLLTGLAFWQAQGPSVGISLGCSVGLFVLWLVGREYGGRACFQHCYLRLLLWGGKIFPLRLSRFLHAADTRLLLRHVGGGYSFVHPLLQEYFATLGTVPSIDKETMNDHKSVRTSQSVRGQAFSSRMYKRRKKRSPATSVKRIKGLL